MSNANTKPDKPCDNADFRSNLPCYAKKGDLCCGAGCWENKRGDRGKNREILLSCPWIERVRHHWREYVLKRPLSDAKS